MLGSLPDFQNYSTIVNNSYSQTARDGYDYDNIHAFNSIGGVDSACGLVGQSLIDYEFNEEIDEYKKIDTSLASQYFQKDNQKPLEEEKHLKLQYHLLNDIEHRSLGRFPGRH